MLIVENNYLRMNNELVLLNRYGLDHYPHSVFDLSNFSNITHICSHNCKSVFKIIIFSTVWMAQFRANRFVWQEILHMEDQVEKSSGILSAR